MTIASNPLLQNHPHAQLDGERQTVTRLIRAVAQAGVRTDPMSIVNFYVALKSKPLAILIGPAQSGKIALVQSLAQVLTGGDPLRCQMMVGHAWWAGASREVALFTEAQTRFNTDKILALIEEAWKPENVNRVFLACLTRISPAELMGFFSEVAFQLRHGQIMRLPTTHLSEPIPYPPNLFLVGTMDTTRLDESDEDLLSMTTIIQWQADEELEAALPSSPVRALSNGDSEFLRSLVRDERAARLKLQHVLGKRLPAVWPLIRIETVLRRHVVDLPPSAPGEAMIYLANAWTRRGPGLFDLSPTTNLEIALDLSIAQSVLPHAQASIQRSPALREELRATLNGKFPRSAALLESLG
ncbi:MAG TPA: hypothetical protein VJL59_13740 [Anaerolineales bacterium]|nr:hypothetical protein [Anaerolineales bacterium]